MADPTKAEDSNIKQEVDYGKSTLFRFSMLNTAPATVDTKAAVIIKPNNAPLASSKSLSAKKAKAKVGDKSIALDEIKELNSDLFQFSEWLAANKSERNLQALADKVTDLSPLTNDKESIIWENIYNHVNTGEGSWLLEKCNNFLRGSAVVKLIQEYLDVDPANTLDGVEEEIWDTAYAPIAIPDDVIPIVEKQEQKITSKLSPEQYRMFKTRHLAAIASTQKEELERHLSRLEKEKAKYQTAYNNAFQEAQTKYTAAQTKYTEDLTLYNATQEASSGDGSSNATPPTPPTFEFKFPAYSTEYLKKDECNSDLVELVESVSELNSCCKSLDKVEAYLRDLLKQANDDYFKNIPIRSSSSVNFNGHSISLDFRPPHNSFLVQAIKLLPFHRDHTIVLTQFARHGMDKMEVISLDVNPGTESTLTEVGYRKVFERADFTSFVIAENATPIGKEKTIPISGSIQSENGLMTTPVNLSVSREFLQYYTANELNIEKSNARSASNDGEVGGDTITFYGIKKIGVLDYMRVEQEVCCYVPGEVSHIENIMAKEYKEKLSRLLTREEITTEEAEEREDERTKDVSTTDRYEMHKEIAQMLSKEQSQQIGVNAGVNASYNGGAYQVGVTAGTNLNFTNSSSQSTNMTVSENIAREVTQKATERILKKVSYKRIAKMLREHEETNKHGFDNRNGSSHVVGIYRWIDKIYKNTLINYGKRLIYEFMVPEPSKNFKYWMNEEAKRGQSNGSGYTPVEPINPNTLVGSYGDVDSSSFKWTDIKRENYANIAAVYGADVEPCPESGLSIGKSFTEAATRKMRANHSDWDETVGSFKFEIEIPDGYVCKQCFVDFSQVNNFIDGKGKPQSVIHVDVRHRTNYIPHGWNINYAGSGNDDQNYLFDEPNLYVQKVLPIGVTTYNTAGFTLNVIARCELSDDSFKTWQQNTYRAIMEAYNKKYQAYLDSQKAYQAPEEQKADFNYNPGKGRAIEGRELKRACIELMMRNSLNWVLLNMDVTNYFNPLNNSFYSINQDSLTEYNNKYIKFFEEAFEWDLMSYTFLPYMYGRMQDWQDLITQKSPADPLFEAFLQSAMAQVQLTVKPEYERMVLYFFDTGQIAPSKDYVPGGRFDYYKSLLSSLKITDYKEQITPVKIKTWESRVPTDLVILQNDAHPLTTKGLPCKCDDGFAQEGLGDGKDGGQLVPYQSDYGPIIKDVKDALIDVVKTVGDISKGGTTEPKPVETPPTNP